mmetsp:Transcript_14547/g.50680  ORF Transcript_14547/g.50680 Transcript_14547/m.50680 type:complete len:293 (-) Transcript_14547:1101-1979(-)
MPTTAMPSTISATGASRCRQLAVWHSTSSGMMSVEARKMRTPLLNASSVERTSSLTEPTESATAVPTKAVSADRKFRPSAALTDSPARRRMRYSATSCGASWRTTARVTAQPTDDEHAANEAPMTMPSTRLWKASPITMVCTTESSSAKRAHESAPDAGDSFAVAFAASSSATTTTCVPSSRAALAASPVATSAPDTSATTSSAAADRSSAASASALATAAASPAGGTSAPSAASVPSSSFSSTTESSTASACSLLSSAASVAPAAPTDALRAPPSRCAWPTATLVSPSSAS